MSANLRRATDISEINPPRPHLSPPPFTLPQAHHLTKLTREPARYSLDTVAIEAVDQPLNLSRLARAVEALKDNERSSPELWGGGRHVGGWQLGLKD